MAQADTFAYLLPSGLTIEIENLPSKERGGQDAARSGKDEPLPIQTVLAPLGEVVALVFEQIRSAVKAPDKVTLELGASLKGKSSLVIVSGETAATLKVTLSWENRGG